MLAGLFASSPAHSQSTADIVKAFERLVVRITRHDGAVRSGFVVVPQGGDVMIVTVVDAVADAESVRLSDSGGRAYVGRVVLRDQRSGVATIAVSNWAGPRVVDLDLRALRQDERIVVIGFEAAGRELSYVALKAAGRDRLDRALPAGFEGGPVVSASDQRVVGMLQSVQGSVISSGTIGTAILTRPSQIATPTSPARTPSAGAIISPSTPASTTRTDDEITIYVFPVGATVSVDGSPIGPAPARFRPGSRGPKAYRVTGASPGRLTLSRALSVPSEVPPTLFLPREAAGDPTTPRGRELLRRLQDALAVGEGVQAAAYARELLTEAAVLAETRVYLATAMWLQRSYAEAVAAARSHIGIYGETPASQDAYILLGTVYEERRQHQEALTAYKLAVKVQPAFGGEFQRRVDATDAAIRAAARQVAENPADRAARIRLGLLYEAKGRFKEGMLEFKNIVFTAPTLVRNSVGPTTGPQGIAVHTFPRQAFVYVGDRRVGPSPITVTGPLPDDLTIRVSLAGYAEMRRSVRPRERSQLLFVLLPTLEGYGRTRFAVDNIREGLQGFADGRWPAATRHFVEALESDYTLVRLRAYVATGYYMQGRLTEAMEALRAYLNVRNGDTTAMLCYALMGVILEEQSRYQEALTAYKLALKLHPSISPVLGLPPAMSDVEIGVLLATAERTPEDPHLQYRLGVAFEHKGRFLEGMHALRRALFLLRTT
ncbi:MAG: tetratricopeptide repeat protein [Armatimonadota bacterium]|nr:tetratricopeptide repeat protein [Armatimonadota bacterium]